MLLASCGSGGETGGSGSGGDGGGGGQPNDNLNNGTNDPIALSEIDLDFDVQNTTEFARHELICASIPFPQGAVNNLSEFGVPGFETTWLPMQQWPDDSVRVAQVQFVDSVPANTRQTYRVLDGQSAISASFSQHPWVAQRWSQIELGARVRDTNGHKYQAQISGSGEVLQETAMKRVRRWRLYHESAGGTGGIGRDYLTSMFYVTEYRDTPFVTVDWVFGNDYLGADEPAGSTDKNLYPIGPVDVDDVALVTRGFDEVVPYRPEWHGIAAGVAESGGRTAHVVMNDDWMADGQCRRYRFSMRLEDPSAASTLKQTWRDRFDGYAASPIYSLSALLAWQKCRALTMLGAPMDGPSNAAARAESDWNRWLGRDHFGTWGSFGDTKGSNATGTPRNTPLSEDVAHAAQSRDLRLLTILEQKCWAQAMRPFHLHGLDLPAEPEVQLWDGPLSINNHFARDLAPESFGRRAQRANDPWPAYRTRMQSGGHPHGWNPYDQSHWTTDLQFDYWTNTADEHAKYELQMLGQCLRGILHYHPGYNTHTTGHTRAEGWAMQSYVQIYLATRDEALKQKAIRRSRDVLFAQRLDHPSMALDSLPPDPSVQYPVSDYLWYTPWQHYSVMLGFLSAYIHLEDPVFLSLAEGCVSALDYAWVDDYLDPATNTLHSGLRYTCVLEVDGNPVPANYFDSRTDYSVSFVRGSQSRTVATGLIHVARWTRSQSVADTARSLARRLVPALTEDLRWEKWIYLIPETELTGN